MADTVVSKAPTSRWTGLQIRVLLTLLLVVTSNYVDRSLLGVLQEPVKNDLKLTDWQLGLIGGPSFALFYALAGLPSARWAQRANRAHILPIILTVWSSMTALCGAAQNFAMLALARAGVGLGEGGCIPISHSMVADYFSTKQRGMAIAVLGCAPSIGGFVAATVGTLIAQTWGWRAAFICVGLPGVLLAVVIRMTLKDPRPTPPPEDRAGRRKSLAADLGFLLRNRPFCCIVLANSFSNVGNSALGLFTASYFMRVYNLSLVQVGAIYATALGVAGFAGTILSGFMADRMAGPRGRSYVLIPAFGAAAAGLFFAVAFTREHWQTAVVFVILGNLVMDMKTPSLAAVQSISPPHMRPTASAVLFFGITVCGATIGAPLAGAVSDFVANSMLPAGWGHMAQACPGGKGPAGAAQAVMSTCHAASAAGVRAALLNASAIFGISAFFFLLASRWINMTSEDAKIAAT